MILLVILILISPLFGVYLSDLVGYHEPLDLAAEHIGLPDLNEELNWTPLYDYGFPALHPVLGYIVSGFIGVALILGIGMLLTRIVSKSECVLENEAKE
jgi:cobalt/nickel transport protein